MEKDVSTPGLARQSVGDMPQLRGAADTPGDDLMLDEDNDADMYAMDGPHMDLEEEDLIPPPMSEDVATKPPRQSELTDLSGTPLLGRDSLLDTPGSIRVRAAGGGASAVELLTSEDLSAGDGAEGAAAAAAVATKAAQRRRAKRRFVLHGTVCKRGLRVCVLLRRGVMCALSADRPSHGRCACVGVFACWCVGVLACLRVCGDCAHQCTHARQDDPVAPGHHPGVERQHSGHAPPTRNDRHAPATST